MNAGVDDFVNKAGFSARDLQGIDRWEAWTPTYSLTTVGAVTISGRYRVIGRKCEFQVKVSAATSIASTAGTHYIDLPIAAQGLSGMAVMTNDTTNIAVGVGHIDVATSRAYLPTQAASGNTFNVSGWYEV